jgi:hypothetical protein
VLPVISRPCAIGPALTFQVPDTTHWGGYSLSCHNGWVAPSSRNCFGYLHVVDLRGERPKERVDSNMVVHQMMGLACTCVGAIGVRFFVPSAAVAGQVGDDGPRGFVGATHYCASTFRESLFLRDGDMWEPGIVPIQQLP